MNQPKKEKASKKIIKPNLRDTDKVLFVMTIILIIVGTLSIVSASSRETVVRYDYSVYHFFFQHLKMVGIGIAFYCLIVRIPTKAYKLFAPIAWVAVTALVIGTFIYGSAKGRGNLNWINLFGFIFQPSEVSKPIIIVTLAMIFEGLSKYVKSKDFNMWNYLGIWILLGLTIPAIVFLQGDLGTAIIITGISFFMFLASPLDKKNRIKCISALAIGGILLLAILQLGRGYVLTDVQHDRIFKFYNPCSRYEDNGYQICNGFIAINDGGLFGQGIGKSKQKYSYIPDPHTDSIFAILVEESGLLMGIIILLLYFVILYRMLKISSDSKNYRGKYLAFGMAIYLFFHILLNLGGLLGIIPLTGVPLPLISYGGTFTISFIASLAVVQRVNIENRALTKIEPVK